MRIIYLLFAMFLLVLSSCGGIIKSYIQNDTENVPPDFGKQRTTLIVIEQKKKAYNKEVENIVKKYYFGEYVFVSENDLTKEPYRDTIKYRYLLNDNVSIDNMASTGSRSFYITDRVARKSYGTGVSSGASWTTVLKEYLKKLESERKKNREKGS